MEIKTVITDSFEMEYFSFGDAKEGEKKRAFVILPGVSMKSVMLSADAIAQGFAAFSEHYTVYTFDRKKNLQEGYSVLDMAEDTARAMKEIGIENADIFGASQGGMIALAIAINHPELVHALYLGSTMARPGKMANAVMKEWYDLAKGEDVQALNHCVNTKIYSSTYYDTYKEIFAALEKEGSREEMDRFAALVKACQDFDVYDRLGKLQAPVFVVAAKEDHVLSCEASEELAKALDCPITLYEGYSHAVYDEAEDFRPRMLKALLGKA